MLATFRNEASTSGTRQVAACNGKCGGGGVGSMPESTDGRGRLWLVGGVLLDSCARDHAANESDLPTHSIDIGYGGNPYADLRARAPCER